MKWKDKLIDHLVTQLKKDPEWKEVLDQIIFDKSIGIHLAVFNEPFLSLICQGKKKVESRFSQNKISPFEKVASGDIVLMKESGGNVWGMFITGPVMFYTFLNGERLGEIEKSYGNNIGTQYDNFFWVNRANANYCSIIEISRVKKLIPFHIGKNDRSGWTTIKLGLGNTLFRIDS